MHSSLLTVDRLLDDPGWVNPFSEVSALAIYSYRPLCIGRAAYCESDTCWSTTALQVHDKHFQEKPYNYYHYL